MSDDFSDIWAKLFGPPRSTGVDKLADAAKQAAFARMEMLRPVVAELQSLTGDADVIERAVGIYSAIVKHVRDGGTVVFMGPTGLARTLKVKVKR